MLECTQFQFNRFSAPDFQPLSVAPYSESESAFSSLLTPAEVAGHATELKVLSSLCLSTSARCLYQSAPHLQPSTSASHLPHQQPHAVALLVCVGIRVSSVTFLFFSDTSVGAGHGPMVWLRQRCSC